MKHPLACALALAIASSAASHVLAAPQDAQPATGAAVPQANMTQSAANPFAPTAPCR